MEKQSRSMALCPVCHGGVDEQRAMCDKLTVYYFGHFYYLMCRQCKGDFLRDPERYVNSKHGARLRVPELCISDGKARGSDMLPTVTDDSEEC